MTNSNFKFSNPRISRIFSSVLTSSRYRSLPVLWKDNICTCQISYFFANFYKLPTNNFYKYTIKCDVIQLMKYVAVCYNDILNIQWRIQEFLNRGARFRRLEFVGSGDCFDVPSHITYHFVLMADIKRHIVKIACWVQSKFTCVMQ